MIIHLAGHDLSSAGATLSSSGLIALEGTVLRHCSTGGMRARFNAVNGYITTDAVLLTQFDGGVARPLATLARSPTGVGWIPVKARPGQTNR